MRFARAFAGLIALVAWAGLAVQWAVTYGTTGSIAGTLWILVAFFTITTNLLVAIVFTQIALGKTVRAWVLAGTCLSILLVGVTFALLLHGLLELSGGSAVANVLLHWITPALGTVYLFTCAQRGGLRWTDPLRWAVYPLAYLVYALARGACTGSYAYPFLNVTVAGWPVVIAHAAAITVSFMAAAYATVWLDHILPETPQTL